MHQKIIFTILLISTPTMHGMQRAAQRSQLKPDLRAPAQKTLVSIKDVLHAHRSESERSLRKKEKAAGQCAAAREKRTAKRKMLRYLNGLQEDAPAQHTTSYGTHLSPTEVKLILAITMLGLAAQPLVIDAMTKCVEPIIKAAHSK